MIPRPKITGPIKFRYFSYGPVENCRDSLPVSVSGKLLKFSNELSLSRKLGVDEGQTQEQRSMFSCLET